MINFRGIKKADNFIGMSLMNRIAGYCIFRIAKVSRNLSSKLQLAGDVANYANWLKIMFGNPRAFFNREQLFSFLLQYELSENVIVLEFGVARGYLTQEILNRDISKRISSWHGFDTFEGLPQSWRNYEKGAFSNNGKTPLINDPRIEWHVGFAQECIKSMPIEQLQSQPLMVVFDLDLEEPTKVVMKYLAPALKEGDIVYFDEAFDHGERRVIMECLIPVFDLQVVGTTPLAIAFKVRGRQTQDGK